MACFDYKIDISCIEFIIFPSDSSPLISFLLQVYTIFYYLICHLSTNFDVNLVNGHLYMRASVFIHMHRREECNHAHLNDSVRYGVSLQLYLCSPR